MCTMPLAKGACQATLRRFYFDREAGTCKLFIFGGCQGNENNFETMDDCIENCIGPPEEVLENGEEAAGSSLVISTTTLEPTNNAVTTARRIRPSSPKSSW